MDALLARVQSKLDYLTTDEHMKIAKAYAVAEEAHRGDYRKSGEPFITHPVAVTEILAELKLDVEALVAGLLHDTVEDTQEKAQPVTFARIEAEFGPEVRAIVEGETKISKLGKLASSDYHDEQSENLRQMLLSMAQDVRIILVKLADRLHNMRTLGSMPGHKQLRIAKETIEIFAPLANRLGIQNIKSELEDLCLFYLEPERYKALQRQIRTRSVERENLVQDAIILLEARMTEEGFRFEVSGRTKHIYSVYRKMKRDNRAIDQIFDLMAIRVILEAPRHNLHKEKTMCYRALGLIHSLWTPIPGRFKDYVAVPKPNGYQSLHTTVIGLKGQPIEVQIRTRRMHQVAEYGVAAHWAYKEGLADPAEIQKRMDWLQQLYELDNDTDTATSFVETVKHDVLSERVLVFTPQGDVFNLPRGSTPIDFAYHIHTEVGHRCIGARVNGEIVPLGYALQTGDRVEILTNRGGEARPSQDWLNIAVTRSAKQKIRTFYRAEEREDMLESGRKTLERALRRKQLPLKEFTSRAKLEEAALVLVKTNQADDLLLALGDKRLSAKQVIEVLCPDLIALKKTQPLSRSVKYGTGGIYVDGLDAPASLAQCCAPVRGDDVVGYITRGRGVTVHRVRCPNVHRLMLAEQERFVPVSWDQPSDERYPVDFEVIGIDRTGLLKDVMDVLTSMNKSANRVTADVQNTSNARIHFRIDVKGKDEIDYVRDNMLKIPDVTTVYRTRPGIKD